MMSSESDPSEAGRCVYLDHNATTPLAPEVVRDIIDALSSAWGNPSSQHALGRRAHDMIEKAREQVARMINAQPNEIIFTSGGTEANNTVINSAIQQHRRRKVRSADGQHSNNRPHIISTTVEHDSVNKYLQYLQQRGDIDVSYVAPSAVTGHIESQEVIGHVTSDTCLVTVMMANNETGIIHDIRGIMSSIHACMSSTCHILTHTDAAQAIGKIPVNVKDLDVNYLTIVGHKFYGPRIGALYIRDLGSKAEQLEPLIFGGGQEMGYRSGTPNTPMIVGLGCACQLVTDNLDAYASHMTHIRDYLINRLKTVFECRGYTVHINGAHYDTDRAAAASILPNTCNVSLMKPSSSLCDERNTQSSRHILYHCRHKLQASVGAACHSEGDDDVVSPVLLSYGISRDVAIRAIRLSVGRDTSVSDIDCTVDTLLHSVLDTD